MAEGGTSPESAKDKLRTEMICRLSKTDAHFKHQQRGEPDLSVDEKSNIAIDILKKSPALFLERFSKYLVLEDMAYFNDQKDDYCIDFYTREIAKRCADTSQKVVKNRRYRALQELMDEGEYFSEDEMKWRDPLLFEQMIGQYKSESEKADEIKEEIDKSDLRFSTILLKHMDTQANKQFYEILKEREEEQEEEEEESDEEEEEEEDDSEMEDESTSKSKSAKKAAKDDEEMGTENDGESEVSEMERNLLRTEFLRIMQERFLSGKDSNFDYSKVDNNTDYDSLDIVGRDAEEKYFDADDGQFGMSDSDTEEGPERDNCDRLLRRRLEGMELRTKEEEDGQREERQGTAIGDMDIDDYMTYVPSEDLIQACQTESS